MKKEIPRMVKIASRIAKTTDDILMGAGVVLPKNP